MTSKVSFELRRKASQALAIAIALEPEQLATYLANLESESPELCREVETLLTSYKAAIEKGFLNSPLDLADELSNRLELLHEGEEFRASASSKSICDSATGSFEYTLRTPSKEVQLPDDLQIDSYQIQGILGVGGYGVVYLAEDINLHRQVALKLANKREADKGQADQSFLDEARRVAQLDHPGIVRILHVGHGEDFAWYLVMEYIDGPSLQDVIKIGGYSIPEMAGVFVKIAEAVHYANSHNIFHCDLKPGNILLRDEWTPCVVDFGMALHVQEQQAQAGRVAGTPAYMSPEQVRGENHRLDGRTDIWSLGVMLYEALTGERPFRGKDAWKLFEDVLYREPRPLRQINPGISSELERICLRCLSKRMADRYSTALDIADDLNHWLQGKVKTTADCSTVLSSGGYSEPKSDRAVQVVPRGLRPYGVIDSVFFLELLPGPRTRKGLPESVERWIDSIEMSQNPLQNAVNVLYGPSGSGKSSILRAGVLPRLNEKTTIIITDAGSGKLEENLLTAIRQEFPQVSRKSSLSETCADIRRNERLGSNRKLLIVVDQFEQWLHLHQSREIGELVLALRHCDGKKLQCMLTVRSDFWQSITRFMEQLEIPLVEQVNCGRVDLFDFRHARKVLTLLGQAYNCLPPAPEPLPSDRVDFLDRAIKQIEENGWIMPVRLALFAEMMKSREWTPAILQQLGGERGIGVAFLDQTFDSEHALLTHRRHSQAAQRVLAELLPNPGSDLKGRSRLKVQLLANSGLQDKPDRFRELMDILDKQLRLITPTEFYETATNKSDGHQSSTSIAGYKPSYQLSHDYLVPALREWLARKQLETRQGRAEACLEERSRQWEHTKEARYLPSLTETCRIALFTSHDSWGMLPRSMMRRALFFYSGRAALLSVLIAGVVGVATMFHSSDPLPTFLNPSLPVSQRERALQALDLNNSYVLDAFVDPLRQEMDDNLRRQAIRKLQEFATFLHEHNHRNDGFLRESLVDTAKSLLDMEPLESIRLDDDSREHLFEIVRLFSTQASTLRFVNEHPELIRARLAPILSTFFDQLDISNLAGEAEDAERAEDNEALAYELIRYLNSPGGSDPNIGATKALDRMTPSELVILFTEVFSSKQLNYAAESLAIYLKALPVDVRYSRGRLIQEAAVDELRNQIAISVNELEVIGDSQISYLLENTAAITAFVPTRDPTLARIVSDIITDAELFRKSDVLDTACRAAVILVADKNLAPEVTSGLQESLVDLLNDKNSAGGSYLRKLAASALGSAPNRSAIDNLASVALATDEPDGLRLEAITALTRIALELEHSVQLDESELRQMRNDILSVFRELISGRAGHSESFVRDVVDNFSNFAPAEDFPLIVPILMQSQAALLDTKPIYRFMQRCENQIESILTVLFEEMENISPELARSLSIPPDSFVPELVQIYSSTSEQDVQRVSQKCTLALAAILAQHPSQSVRQLADSNLRGIVFDKRMLSIEYSVSEKVRAAQYSAWLHQWHDKILRMVVNPSFQLETIDKETP